MSEETIKPPKYLKKHGRKLWRGILRDYVIEEKHDLALLGEACACVDRIHEARREIDSQGAYFNDRFGQPKEHPGHATERNNKTLLARLLRELSLNIEPPPENRPPGRY